MGRFPRLYPRIPLSRKYNVATDPAGGTAVVLGPIHFGPNPTFHLNSVSLCIGRVSLLKMSNSLQISRFPRTDDEDMMYLAAMRAKYKAPPYNFRTDGSWNPADGVFKSLVESSTKKLRKLCKRHSLNHHGPRRKLIKKMYLHWRASKYEHFGVHVGNGLYFGYGKGYENVRIPTCPCGSRSRSEKKRSDARMEAIKEMAKYIKRHVMEPSRIHYPRYSRKRIHFPRLKEEKYV